MTPVIKHSLRWAQATFVHQPSAYVCRKVQAVAEAFFGYIVRVIAFQLAEMHKRGAYSIIRTYQRIISSDPRDQAPLDPKRLAASAQFLSETLRGQLYTLRSGTAQIQCRVFRANDFFASLGNPVTEGGKQVLKNLSQDTAKKLYFEWTPKGTILPEAADVDPNNRPMILHCHSMGRSMDMDRKFIAMHLAAGLDVTVWDGRGFPGTEGIASEAGYYHDAETVYRHITDPLNYKPSQVYISGFCTGAAIAASLKQNHHTDGAHFIGSNMYSSFEEVLKGYGWIGKLACYGLPRLKDETPTDIREDGFDSVSKFTEMPQGRGDILLIHTDQDTMMPKDTVAKIQEAMKTKGGNVTVIERKFKGSGNPHTQPPYEDPEVWHEYIQFFRKKPSEPAKEGP